MLVSEVPAFREYWYPIAYGDEIGTGAVPVPPLRRRLRGLAPAPGRARARRGRRVPPPQRPPVAGLGRGRLPGVPVPRVALRRRRRLRRDPEQRARRADPAAGPRAVGPGRREVRPGVGVRRRAPRADPRPEGARRGLHARARDVRDVGGVRAPHRRQRPRRQPRGLGAPQLGRHLRRRPGSASSTSSARAPTWRSRSPSPPGSTSSRRPTPASPATSPSARPTPSWCSRSSSGACCATRRTASSTCSTRRAPRSTTATPSSASSSPATTSPDVEKQKGIIAIDRQVQSEDRALLEGVRPDFPLEITTEVHVKSDRMTLEYRKVLAELAAETTGVAPDDSWARTW